MTNEQKIEMVKTLCDETNVETISAFLSFAGDKIYRAVDPGKTCQKEDVLEDYADVQISAAAYYLNKRGWDFQTAHSENGISRTYEAGDLPESILQMLTPKCW